MDDNAQAAVSAAERLAAGEVWIKRNRPSEVPTREDIDLWYTTQHGQSMDAALEAAARVRTTVPDPRIEALQNMIATAVAEHGDLAIKLMLTRRDTIAECLAVLRDLHPPSPPVGMSAVPFDDTEQGRAICALAHNPLGRVTDPLARPANGTGSDPIAEAERRGAEAMREIAAKLTEDFPVFAAANAPKHIAAAIRALDLSGSEAVS